LAAASFFPAIILGIFYKRMNKQGAIAGMISGLGTTLLYMLIYKFNLFGETTPDDWLFGISPEGFGTIGMLVNFAMSFAVSYFTPPPPEDVQEMVESIRFPRGAGTASHH